MEWWKILLICVGSFLLLFILSIILYRQIFKRIYDFILSFIALIVLSPIFIILIIIGAIAMKGNPFFTQRRPGKINKKTGKERIFHLIKFRTMSNAKNENGELLPDSIRLNKYGKFLRKTSLDELPELINILIGSMSIVGPRPLLERYIERYSERQRLRHTVLPGLTGYAQVNGRNAVSWEEKFEKDVWYVEHISLFGDIKIIFKTAICVFRQKGISSQTNITMEEFEGEKSKAA